MPPRFRFNAKRVGLTYSQVPGEFTKEILLETIQGRFAVTNYCIARETHDDGGIHVHAYFEFERKLDSRDPLLFDILGSHPNIQRIRSKSAWLSYLHKEDEDPLTNIAWGSVWTRALRAGSHQGAMDLVEEEKPRDFVLYHERIDHFFRERFRARMEFEPRHELGTFTIPREVRLWFNHYVHADSLPSRFKLLVLWGPTQTGKTTLIRTMAPAHNYFAGMFSLDDYDDTNKINVFDDCEWTYIPNKKALLLGATSQEVILTDKYRAKKRVRALPAVWLTNHIPQWSDEAYWEANSVVVSVQSRLF